MIVEIPLLLDERFSVYVWAVGACEHDVFKHCIQMNNLFEFLLHRTGLYEISNRVQQSSEGILTF